VYTLRPSAETVTPVPALDAETLTKLAAAEAEVRVLRQLLAEVTRTRDSFEQQVMALTAALPAPVSARRLIVARLKGAL